MRLAVYVPESRSLPYVLTAECMQPSLTCEHEYGRLHMKGVVTLDERVLPVIAHTISPETDFEYVIYSGVGIRAVDALIEPAEESVHSNGLASDAS